MNVKTRMSSNQQKFKANAAAVATAGFLGTVLIGSYVHLHTQKLRQELASLIDRVIVVLGDGKWHKIRQIAKDLDVREERVLEVLRFCEEFRFVDLDENGRKAKLDDRLSIFLEEPFAADPQIIHS
jgi:hypothetical protein